MDDSSEDTRVPEGYTAMGLGQAEPSHLAQAALPGLQPRPCCPYGSSLGVWCQVVPGQRLGPALSKKPSLFQGAVASLLLVQWPCGCHLVLAWLLFGPKGYSLSFTVLPPGHEGQGQVSLGCVYPSCGP